MVMHIIVSQSYLFYHANAVGYDGNNIVYCHEVFQ